jgi:rhamnulokinase
MTERAPAFTAFVDPDDPGFYNPSDMEEAILGYCRRTGQAVPPDRGTCLRVVYESLALKYRSVNEEISSVSGQKSAAVHIVGGGSRNILLNQFTADCLGLPVFAGPDEATAVGNIMVQALGTGILASLSDAIPLIMESFPITRYRPLDPGKWEEPFQRFRRIAGMKA